ncbi:MAG: ATP-dependent DNA helicase [Magnetovibrionaceae bacterium]
MTESLCAPEIIQASLPGPAIVCGARTIVWLAEAEAEPEVLDRRALQRRISDQKSPPLVCHGKGLARRLGLSEHQAMRDVLELFAFCLPARFCLPTPRGLAEALELPLPVSLEEQARVLFQAAARLLDGLARAPEPERLKAIAWILWRRARWPWGPSVLTALNAGEEAPHSRQLFEAMMVWKGLDEWEDEAGAAPADHWPVEPVEARARLTRILGPGSEQRDGQRMYAEQVSAAFGPRDEAGHPLVVLADAGTGVGKTLGYVAPASVWAEKNEGTVWISTYTRNLQRQLDGELDRLYPDPAEKAENVVVRKGRENYLCLLNFEEAVRRLETRDGRDAIPLGLMARWIMATRDGDMMGGDFPAWLTDLMGRALTIDLTDTRGECTYSACQHYRSCFIEHSARKARGARIVVANHALVMATAALGGDEAGQPARIVFDEGHHVFQAADGAFSAHLTGLEAAELRRWLLGAEEGRSRRGRGLKERLEDLIVPEARAGEALRDVLKAARILPAGGWHGRITGQATLGPMEEFLSLCRRQVLARAEEEGAGGGSYSLECTPHPPVPGLIDCAQTLKAALEDLRKPVAALVGALYALLDDEADELETRARVRIEAMAGSLERRALQQIAAWNAMLDALAMAPAEDFVDWLGLERRFGREIDVGLHRHWIDPTKPLAEAVIKPAHGVVVTSATLLDHGSGEEWQRAENRTGAKHLEQLAGRVEVSSPYDYPARTKVLVVNDVNRASPDQVASAYRELFLAANGGALGLFTAINRLRATYEKIAEPLEASGLSLLAQHVDPLDTGTLIDIFRSEENACLLGTDAVRDGIDVPGRSLRLIVFDRVPWPRPDILHRARRKAFGGKAFDEAEVRLKLKQAYGRLIRKADDKGVFVMLDRGLPSRLATAFPPGVLVERMGLKQAIGTLRDFLRDDWEAD